MKAGVFLGILNALVTFIKLLAGVRQKMDERTAEMERAKAEALDAEELQKERGRWTKP